MGYIKLLAAKYLSNGLFFGSEIRDDKRCDNSFWHPDEINGILSIWQSGMYRKNNYVTSQFSNLEY